MKYSVGEIVRIKATGEKVKIDDVSIWENKNIYWDYSGSCVKWFEESELKSYIPSRTGKYRNEKGQFVSGYGFGEKQLKRKLQKDINEALLRWNMKMNPDSKQRNYQKKDQQWFDHDYIIKSLERIEKKIDELGRKV